ncbi:MAG: thioredoxin family protein [Acidobacteria bacterium]|nr:thioredoxin family protein [Acidobacteriota bacterium]
MLIRSFKASVLMAALLVAGHTAVFAQATDNNPKPFSREAFDAATAAGKTVMVAFHAPWCPVCKAQEPKIEALLNTEYKNVVAFNVDYDTNVPLRKEMHVLKQATLIMFRGDKEIARLSFQSDDASIRQFFAHAKTTGR